MKARILLLALVTMLLVTSTQAFWPFGSRYRSVADMEKYRFDYYVSRVDEVRALRKQGAEKATQVTPPPPALPEVTVSPERLVLPYLKPYLEDVARYPSSTIASRKLVRQYVKLQRYDLALGELDRIFKYNPSWSEGFMLQADIYEKTDQLAKAKADYDLLVVSDPNWISPRFRRAQLLERMARNQPAQDDWEQISRLAQAQGLDELNAVATRHLQELRNR